MLDYSGRPGVIQGSKMKAERGVRRRWDYQRMLGRDAKMNDFEGEEGDPWARNVDGL